MKKLGTLIVTKPSNLPNCSLEDATEAYLKAWFLFPKGPRFSMGPCNT
jgi:hypothetical protein